LAIALHWQCRDHRFKSDKLHQNEALTKIIFRERFFIALIF
jgi:hypothetical protein